MRHWYFGKHMALINYILWFTVRVHQHSMSRRWLAYGSTTLISISLYFSCGKLQHVRIPVKVTLNISGSPMEIRWGFRKYPGQFDRYRTKDTVMCFATFDELLNRVSIGVRTSHLMTLRQDFSLMRRRLEDKDPNVLVNQCLNICVTNAVNSTLFRDCMTKCH